MKKERFKKVLKAFKKRSFYVFIFCNLFATFLHFACNITMEKQYMKDNLNLFDFQLNEEEMSYLSSFDLLEYNTKPSQDYQRTKSMLENM